MSNLPANTKSELLASIDPAWQALTTTLDRLTVNQMTTLKDPQGWSAKDHLIHLAAWERSVIFFLRGQPRHAGLGVDESVYRHGTFDAINAAIYQQTHEMPLDQAKALLNQVHQQLLESLQPLSDADLLKPYREYLPDDRDDQRLAMNVIYDNTTDHFHEHLGWIKTLIMDQSA